MLSSEMQTLRMSGSPWLASFSWCGEMGRRLFGKNPVGEKSNRSIVPLYAVTMRNLEHAVNFKDLTLQSPGKTEGASGA